MQAKFTNKQSTLKKIDSKEKSGKNAMPRKFINQSSQVSEQKRLIS